MANLSRARLSEPMGHRRAQMLRKETRHSGRSGQGDTCEEQAQGNGETTCACREAIRLPEAEGRAAKRSQEAAFARCDTRRERGKEAVSRRRSIVTRMVDAARGRSRAFPRSERRACVALAQLPRVHCAACFAADSGAEPTKMRRVAQDCDPTAYMYTPSGCKDARIGHFSWVSTVAAKQAARWKANQHGKSRRCA